MRSTFFLIMLAIFNTVLFAQSNDTKLTITPLTGDFYIYTTYGTYKGSPVPANGMYLVTSDGVVLFDTPWDTTQFQPLLDSIRIKHDKNVTICIATHWHDDRTAGLEYYKQKGIRTYTTTLTDAWSKKNEMKRAEYLIQNDTVFHQAKYSFKTFYPGEGHTMDNIVIWFEKERILYAGCLVKGSDAMNLGYMGDANPKAYYSSLINMERKFPAPNYIIISHSDWKDKNSLKHSIQLAKKLREGH